RPRRSARHGSPVRGPGPRCPRPVARATPRRPARAAGCPRSRPPGPAGSSVTSRSAHRAWLAQPGPSSAGLAARTGIARGSLARYHRRMPRVSDLGITIGLLPPGATDSVLDVPGVGLGHATVWRDEPPPPAGRGAARTGVTVLDPGGDLFRSPVPAGGAVLNGAGECTGMLAAREWGLVESPIFLTSTMQVGRVYDAACELQIAEQPAIGTEDVIIPVVAECDDSFLNDARRMQVGPDDVRAALVAARGSAGAAAAVEGAVG